VDAYWQTLQVNKVAIDFSEIYEIISERNWQTLITVLQCI
jgi:hypothetical protein